MADLRVLSLGAGVQSTTLALMAAHGEIGRRYSKGGHTHKETLFLDCAIFADTGWEPRKVYLHLQWLTGCELYTMPDGRLRAVPGEWKGGVLPYPTHIVSKGDIRSHILEAIASGDTRVDQPPFFVANADGELALLRQKCTQAWKKAMIQAKQRELLGVAPGERVPKGVLLESWHGISLDEVHRMKVAKDKWLTFAYPLVMDCDPPMDRHACETWLERNGWTAPKSACIGCPYHSNQYWRHLKDTSPEEWQDAVEFDSAIRHGLPGVKGEAYLHRSLVPLDQVDLRTQREKGQLGFFDDDFGNECEGVCGV